MKPLTLRVLAWTAAAVGLLATLSLYSHPDFLVSLADQIWSCF